MAPQREKKPNEAQKSQKDNGIKKFFPREDKDTGGRLEKFEQGIKDGTISREKIDAGAQQSVILDNKGQKPIDNDQPPQINHNAPKEGATPLSPQVVISEPNGTEDVEMHYLDPQTSNKSQLRSSEHEDSYEAEERSHNPHVSSDHQHLSVHNLTSTQLEDGCLAVLPQEKGKKSQGSLAEEADEDVVIDSWGKLNGSSFVIIQDGPFSVASYRFERRKGYSDPKKPYISSATERISRLQDIDPSGNRVPRYTRDNFVGIYGIVCSNGKRKSTWMKFKWKNLRSEDAKKLVRDCSWEPKCELVRFCGDKKTTEEKTKEVWRNQKQRFSDYQKGKTPQYDPQGRSVHERSPTPCPPGMTIDQYRRDRKEQQDRETSDIKTETSNASRQQATNLQPDKSAIKSKEEFMKQRMRGDEWEKLSDLEKEKRKVELEALYDVYLETVRNSGEGASHATEETSLSVS